MSADNFNTGQQRRPSGNLVIQDQQTQRSDASNNISHFHANSAGYNHGSFRVENRRARPKIVQNVVDQGNAFFSKQASILHTS